MALFYAANTVLFLLPGWAITGTIARRGQLRLIHAAPLSIASSATMGYLAFWIYFGNKVLGEIFSYAVAAASIAVLAVTIKRSRQVRDLARKVARPLVYMFVTGVCYSCFFFLFSNPFAARVDLANVRFFQQVRPGDNLIPFFFAEKIYDRQRPLSPICCGDWLSSDRPPLQAGIFLLQRPLRIFGNTGLHYQLLGTALQCLWICGAWVLLQALGASERRVRQVLGLLVFSGFIFYNSVYTWPKLLAAAFILFTVGILWDSSKDRGLTLFEAGLGSLCFALALMAHPGCVFSAPGLLLIFIWRRRRLAVRSCAWALLAIAAFAAPWLAYQRFYDPPGNRLPKMHLAGVMEIDSRSTWQAIRNAYASQSWAAIVRYKLENLRELIGPAPEKGAALDLIRLDAGDFHSRNWEASRVAQREYIWNAIGILNLGWIGGLALLLRKNKRSETFGSGLLVTMAVVDLIVWSVVLFGPAQTFTEHSSYADILFLSIGLVGFLLSIHPLAGAVLLILELLNFFIVWVWVRPLPLVLAGNRILGPHLQLPMLIAGLICTAGLLWHFSPSYFETGEWQRRGE